VEQRVEVKFIDKDKFEVKTISSNQTLYTDKQSQGHDPCGPNPLELFLSSLGSCIGVFSKMYLTRHNIEFTILKIKVIAEISSGHQLTNIKASVDTDAKFADKKDAFLRFIHACPAHKTIINTQEIDISLN